MFHELSRLLIYFKSHEPNDFIKCYKCFEIDICLLNDL